MVMTEKQKLLAACRGERLDKLPFGARIDLWYNYNSSHDSLPDKYKGWSMIDIMRDLRIGFQHRFLSIVKEEYHDMEVIETKEDPYTTTEFRTPLGNVSKKMMFTALEGPWIGYETEKLFRSEKDYPIIKYVLEHTVPAPDFSSYEALCSKVGEDGLVLTGVGLYSPMQTIMRQIIGYERFFYELMDRPERVEELLELETELQRKKFQIGVQADIEVIHVCGNWSDDIHTPVFQKYFIPWLQEITEFLHRHGKLAMVHIDGENKRLMPFFRETNLDVWEAWTPSPMTKVSNAELKNALGDKGVIWGGIPAILFESTYSDDEFDNYIINQLFKEIAPGYNFIVGMGDNFPFDGKIDRLRRIPELIDKYGNLPIRS